jgi:hypothetical protein
LASLASLRISASSDCLRVGHLPPQQARHHFDAGQRVLQLVGDAGGHLAERGEAIPEPLALLELFDLGQILEEKHRANRHRAVVLDLRERVADHAVQLFQPHLGAIRQMAELEGARQHTDDLGAGAEYLGKRPTDVAGRRRQPEHPVGLVVHQRQRAVAAERDDAVAHAADDVAEKAVLRDHARFTGGSALRQRRDGRRTRRTPLRASAGLLRYIGHGCRHWN